MAITFVSHPATETSGSSPTTSASYTPGSANNQLLLFGISGTVNLAVTTTSGSFSKLTPPGDNSDPDGDVINIWENHTEAASSQTFTLTDAGTPFLAAMLVEYSGVGSLSNGAGVVRTGITSGSNILGTAVTVPTGSVLVAFCISGTSATAVITNSAGTSRWQVADGNLTFRVVDYAGSGASVTPTFTSTENPGDFTVVQIMLNPPSAPSAQPLFNFKPFSSLPEEASLIQGGPQPSLFQFRGPARLSQQTNRLGYFKLPILIEEPVLIQGGPQPSLHQFRNFPVVAIPIAVMLVPVYRPLYT